VDENFVLFVTRLETAHSIQMDAFSTDKLEKIERLSLHVTAKMLISSLALTKTFCHAAQCGVIGFTKDELFFGSKLDIDSQGNAQITWTRQESLASTLAVETVDYPRLALVLFYSVH